MSVAAFASQEHASYVQIVNKAVPELQWNLPAAIPYGTPLAPAQLAATANQPGAFLYTPAAGTVLLPGQQLLTVVFIPSNVNYETVSATVTLIVLAPVGPTFLFALSSESVSGSHVVVSAGRDGFATLVVTPIGAFNLPVSLACTGAGNFRCLFTPAVVPPASIPTPVTLRINYAAPPNRGPPRPPQGPGKGPDPEGATPGRALPSALIAPAVLMVLGRGLRRKRNLSELAAGICVSFLLAVALAGCASRDTAVEIIVTATSVSESRSVPLTVYVH